MGGKEKKLWFKRGKKRDFKKKNKKWKKPIKRQREEWVVSNIMILIGVKGKKRGELRREVILCLQKISICST